MSGIDILYLSYNRKAFTEFSFEQLLANTDWSLVNELVVWDDYSRDGTIDYLREAVQRCPVDATMRVGGYGSPVTLMNKYMENHDAPVFAKIDNDIVVPPGWLNDMAAVMEHNPELELLGMQAGITWTRGPDPVQGGSPLVHRWEEARHIGGVGLMRRSAFDRLPRLNASGTYFGFTLWQERYEPVIGWITPDLHVCSLDTIPFEPWRSLSLDYIRRGWQRKWEPYPRGAYYWNWWPESAREREAA